MKNGLEQNVIALRGDSIVSVEPIIPIKGAGWIQRLRQQEIVQVVFGNGVPENVCADVIENIRKLGVKVLEMEQLDVKETPEIKKHTPPFWAKDWRKKR